MVGFQLFLEAKTYSRTSEKYNGMLHLYDKNNIWQRKKIINFFLQFLKSKYKKKSMSKNWLKFL